jgi:CheY-like chemotaxis protein
LESVPVVLVVEHEEPLQEIVHDALKEGDFDLTTVASGREAIAMIESGVVKSSALVADVNLKGPMKGWEIARLIRQIDPAFPIVYMTGAAADDWRSEGAPNSWRPCSQLRQPKRRMSDWSFCGDGSCARAVCSIGRRFGKGICVRTS